MAVTRKYFQKFPAISYNDYVVRDISLRTKLTQYIHETGIALLPYTIKDGERADMIADFYYGDSYYSWAIYLTNSIVDPYSEWPKDSATITSYLEAKYGSVENAMDDIVRYEVNWAEDTSIISPEQYEALPIENKKYWDPDLGFNNQIISYHRRPLDWVMYNNRLDKIDVVSTDPDVETLNFTLEERMYQYNFADQVAVTSELVSVNSSVSSNTVVLDSTSSDITFTSGNNVAVVKGTLNLLPTAKITGTGLPANTYISQIVNAIAIQLSSTPTQSSNGSYTISNPAFATLVVQKVDFYSVVFSSNTTYATPASFFVYEPDDNGYQDTKNYLYGTKSSANVVVLNHQRIDIEPLADALLANSHLSNNELKYWKSVNAYDDELAKNEKKKNIYVLDKTLIQQLDDTLENLI